MFADNVDAPPVVVDTGVGAGVGTTLALVVVAEGVGAGVGAAAVVVTGCGPHGTLQATGQLNCNSAVIDIPPQLYIDQAAQLSRQIESL